MQMSNPLDVSIVYKDYYSLWCPLYRLCFSQSSNILVSRHAIGSVEEIITVYCPQCLTRYSDDEVFDMNSRCPSCFQCPSCMGILLNLSNSDDEVEEKWTCTNCHQVYPVPADDDNDNSEIIFSALLSYLQKADKGFDNNNNSNTIDSQRTTWHFEDLEKKIEARMNDKLHTVVSDLPVDNVLSPRMFNRMTFGMPLRSKRTVRCRHDMELGKMNILIQPKLFPLDGDSSLRVQKGKWWVKDSSAIHFVPQIAVLQAPDLTPLQSVDNDNNNSKNWSTTMILRITNPREVPTILTIHQNAIVFDTNDTNDEEGVTAAGKVVENEFVCQNELGIFEMMNGKDYLTLQTSPLPSSSSSSDGIMTIALEGYEDELLRDDDSGSGSVDIYQSPLDNSGWKCVVNGNLAILHVPIVCCDEAVVSATSKVMVPLHFSFVLDENNKDIPIQTKLIFQYQLPSLQAQVV